MEYCRLCLSENLHGKNEMYNIFFCNDLIKNEETGKQQINTNCIRSILHKYCWFLILEPDEHSHQICQQCWETVNEFDRFTNQIKKAQIKLFNIIAAKPLCPSEENNQVIVTFEQVTPKVEIDSDTLDDAVDAFDDVDSSYKDSCDNFTEIIQEIGYLYKSKKKKNEQSKKIRLPPLKTGKTNKQHQKLSAEDEAIINEYFKMDCEICLEKLPNFRSLFEHYSQSHKLRGYLRCCGKKLKRCDALEHIALHKNPDAFNCTICQKSYQCSYSLKIHMKQHDATFEPYQCKKCPRSFMKPESLRFHIRSFHQEKKDQQHQGKIEDTVPPKITENDFPCNVCNKSFSSELQRSRHRHRNTPVICAICAKVCASENGLRIHHDAAHSVDNRQVQCNECQRWFKNEETRRVHARRHKIELHTCDICNREFTNVIMFKQHKRRSHIPLNHTCELCNKSFGVPEALRKHMKRHTGQLLKCPFCVNILETKNGLEYHLQKWHPNEVENRVI